MDLFSLSLSAASLAGQSVLHTVFLFRFAGRRRPVGASALYLLLLCACEWCFSRYAVGAGPAVVVQVLLLYGTGRFTLKERRPGTWAAALLAVYITQLSFGVVNSAEAVIFPRLVGKPLLYPALLLAELASLLVNAGCCAAALWLLPPEEGRGTPDLPLLLLPCLFFFAAELYILRTAYSSLPASSGEEAGKHAALLVLQLLGLGALLCTLYAYRRVCREFQARAALHSLTQAARAQRTYTAEAQARYARTRAFRHDIQNHLTVLSGLLKGGRTGEAAAYLEKLEAASAALSLPVCTGSPEVDVLLGEKLEAARAAGVETEVSLRLPNPCGADSLDLCVIFANALDNAIAACQAAGGEKRLRVAGERQGDFCLLIFENTCSAGPMPPEGVGLANIRAAAEKYRGAVLAEKTDRRFVLHVLLNIS